MNQRILMIAGGTGGHIFPALAAARTFRENGFDVQWLGSRIGMEADLVGNEFPMTFVSIKAIRGKSIFSKLLSPLRLGLATWQAWRVIKKLKPDLVIGMGGFVSGPGGLAARLAKKSLVIHEQNAIAGMTNRFLSKYAQLVLEGFPNAFPNNITAKTIGNPVRPAISNIAVPAERFKQRTGPLRILIIGGSRGARAINDTVIRVLKTYPTLDQLTIWHQTGEFDFAAIQSAYDHIAISAKIEPFIEDMAAAYAWADLLICRAGALSVAEIAAAGVASILIPFPFAVDDHQYANGLYLAQAGAAELIRQSDFTEARLRQILQQYANDRARLQDMAQRARQLAKPQALTTMVALCRQLIGNERCA